VNLQVDRRWLTAQSTIGNLYVDGAWECFTLEDYVRADPVLVTAVNEAKVAGETAIPAGRYRVVITPSTRFKCSLPLLLQVPGFEGVRIHPGNTDADTEGCLLVGRQRQHDRVSESRPAFEALFAKLQAGVAAGEVWLTITDPEPVTTA
jgi:hypothetical protein